MPRRTDVPARGAAFPARHRGSTDPSTVQLARIEDATRVLGAGTRAVAWVQGCALQCAGCVVPESHAAGGSPWPVAALAERFLALPADLDGLTFSGGEPMLQGPALAALIRVLRPERPHWTFMSYSGYRHDVLVRRGSAGQRALLAELDVLVDGPFLQGRVAKLLWRGSANQRVLALTDAGRRSLQGYDLDAPGATEYSLDGGVFTWTGIPPVGHRAAEGAVASERALIWEQRPATSVQRSGAEAMGASSRPAAPRHHDTKEMR